MFEAQEIVFLHQTHSSIVCHVDQFPNQSNQLSRFSRFVGDALVTQTSNRLLCVRTADCVPILIAHKTRPIVAAVHVGWKGIVLEKILENTAQVLKGLDALSHYCVVMGPCLHQNSFQAGSIIHNNVAHKKYFKAAHYFDFPLFVYDRLCFLGFEDIERIEVDTYTHPEFFSFRRGMHQGMRQGRQASVIMLKDMPLKIG